MSKKNLPPPPPPPPAPDIKKRNAVTQPVKTRNAVSEPVKTSEKPTPPPPAPSIPAPRPLKKVPHKKVSSSKTLGELLKKLMGKRKGDMVKNYANGGGVRPAINEYS